MPLFNFSSALCKLYHHCHPFVAGVQITASELMSCEWCTERRLPALFLQTTAAERHRLMGCLGISAGSVKWYNCQSKRYIASL